MTKCTYQSFLFSIAPIPSAFIQHGSTSVDTLFLLSQTMKLWTMLGNYHSSDLGAGFWPWKPVRVYGISMSKRRAFERIWSIIISSNGSPHPIQLPTIIKRRRKERQQLANGSSIAPSTSSGRSNHTLYVGFTECLAAEKQSWRLLSLTI